MIANISLPKIYSKKRKTSISSRFTFELARVQDAGYVTKLAQKIIGKNTDDQFFLFLHYWNTHTPYNCPKRYMIRDKPRHNPIEIIA